MASEGKARRPKGFVRVPVDGYGTPRSVTAPPVFQDGRQSASLLSGEIRCTLTALTPLLAANYQFALKTVAGIERVHGDDKNVRLPPGWGLFEPGEEEQELVVAADKGLLEPLRLADGRVAFAGSAPKGMLSHSLGALLAAPMARVRERTYSYRPNMRFTNPKTDRHVREGRPAVVESWDEESGTLSLRVLPAAAMSKILFVREEAIKKLNDPPPGTRQTDGVRGVRICGPRGQRLDADEGGNREDLGGYVYFAYRGGLDGTGEMARLFAGKMDKSGCNEQEALVYSAVLVPARFLREDASTVLPVQPEVLRMHDATVRHLTDETEGHLRPEHPLTDDNFRRVRGKVLSGMRAASEAIREPNTLVYVEVENDDAGRPMRVNSLGTNYYYRFRKVDSVRQTWTGTGYRDRPILMPLEEEKPDPDADAEHSPPRHLSAQRGLLGYAEDSTNPGTIGVGRGDFRQLAGRLGFNVAVEVLGDGIDGHDETRFMDADYGCVVPLRVLGNPRPSDEAQYIERNGGLIANRRDRADHLGYGDILDDPRGELAGRAFYRHQPAAANDPNLYTLDPDRDLEALRSNQAALARYVSAPGTRYRVTLRFRDLRPWELGAVLTCLRPRLLEKPGGALAEPGKTDPSHAIKLGHARPLGLGSVRVDVDDVRLLQQDGTLVISANVAHDALAAFAKIEIDPRVRKQWLEVHRYRGEQPVAYPTRAEKKKRGEEHKPAKKTILAHYSHVHSEYAVDRRLAPEEDATGDRNGEDQQPGGRRPPRNGSRPRQR